MVPTLEGDIAFRLVNSSKPDRSSSTTKAIETRWPSTCCPTLAAACHIRISTPSREHPPPANRRARPARRRQAERTSCSGAVSAADLGTRAGPVTSLIRSEAPACSAVYIIQAPDEIEMDRCSSPDHRRLAADGLLTLSNEALWTGLTTTVAAESHLFGHHWPATSSPRMMEAGA